MHTNCFYNFKTALYSSAVVKKGFNSSIKLFYCEAEGWPSFRCIITNRPLTIINEVLRLSGSPFVAITASP